MCVVYGLNFLDKTSISYASIMGLIDDIKLTGSDYQWLGSMFVSILHISKTCIDCTLNN